MTSGVLVRTNLFIGSRFWTTYTNFDTCSQSCIATCGKYRCTSTFSALNFSSIFSKPSVVRQKTFPPIFGLFAIFDPNFVNIVAPSSDENVKCVAILKGRSLLKTVETVSKFIHKP